LQNTKQQKGESNMQKKQEHIWLVLSAVAFFFSPTYLTPFINSTGGLPI
jgi:hypothetical protein